MKNYESPFEVNEYYSQYGLHILRQQAPESLGICQMPAVEQLPADWQLEAAQTTPDVLGGFLVYAQAVSDRFNEQSGPVAFAYNANSYVIAKTEPAAESLDEQPPAIYQLVCLENGSQVSFDSARLQRILQIGDFGEAEQLAEQTAVVGGFTPKFDEDDPIRRLMAGAGKRIRISTLDQLQRLDNLVRAGLKIDRSKLVISPGPEVLEGLESLVDREAMRALNVLMSPAYTAGTVTLRRHLRFLEYVREASERRAETADQRPLKPLTSYDILRLYATEARPDFSDIFRSNLVQLVQDPDGLHFVTVKLNFNILRALPDLDHEIYGKGRLGKIIVIESRHFIIDNAEAVDPEGRRLLRSGDSFLLDKAQPYPWVRPDQIR